MKEREREKEIDRERKRETRRGCRITEFARLRWGCVQDKERAGSESRCWAGWLASFANIVPLYLITRHSYTRFYCSRARSAASSSTSTSSITSTSTSSFSSSFSFSFIFSSISISSSSSSSSGYYYVFFFSIFIRLLHYTNWRKSFIIRSNEDGFEDGRRSREYKEIVDWGWYIIFLFVFCLVFFFFYEESRKERERESCIKEEICNYYNDVFF